MESVYLEQKGPDEKTGKGDVDAQEGNTPVAVCSFEYRKSLNLRASEFLDISNPTTFLFLKFSNLSLGTQKYRVVEL